MRYRRVLVAGGTYFFTVNLADRRSDILVRYVDDLRQVLDKVKAAHPFTLVAMAAMPEHLHASGGCRRAMRIIRCAGPYSRRVFRGD